MPAPMSAHEVVAVFVFLKNFVFFFLPLPEEKGKISLLGV